MASVARQPATSMMARVDRLDLVLAYLEEMHHHQQQHHHVSSPSTPTTLSDRDRDSSAASTPRGSSSWRRASCRPAKEALEEAQAKGSLVDRIAFLEDRVLRMEEDLAITPPDPEKTMSVDQRKEKLQQVLHGNKKTTKGFKSLVKSCVRGKLNTND